MRKRSGAMCAETEASYLKLAKLAQKSDSLFYNESSPFNDEIYKMDLEQSSLPEFSPNYYSPQQNPHKSADNIIYDDFEFDLDSHDVLQLENDEKSCLDMNEIEKKITVNIMVLGDSKINKKLFLNSCFEENAGNQNCNGNSQFNKFQMQCYFREYCLDLIIKQVKINEKAIECTCKFWVKNLDEIKFDSIVQAYYKSIQSFIFLYDENNPSTYAQIQKIYQDIIEIRMGATFQAVLLALRSGDSQLKGAQEIQQKYNFQTKYQTTLSDFQVNHEIMQQIIKTQI